LRRSFRGVNAVEVTHSAAYFTSREPSFPGCLGDVCEGPGVADASVTSRVAWNLLIE
jgi:hypothetical protein